MLLRCLFSLRPWFSKFGFLRHPRCGFIRRSRYVFDKFAHLQRNSTGNENARLRTAQPRGQKPYKGQLPTLLTQATNTQHLQALNSTNFETIATTRATLNQDHHHTPVNFGKQLNRDYPNHRRKGCVTVA